MFYSEKTCGFYDSEINGDAIPGDAVEITAAQHTTLLDGQSRGKRIVADKNGFPILADPPAPTVSDVWLRIKAERDRRTENGGFQVGGKWFHSDQKSRSQQLGLVLLGASIPAGLQWKTMDGSFVTMTPALAQQILVSATASDQAIFSVAEAHRAALESCADPASYDYSGNWPKVFGDG